MATILSFGTVREYHCIKTTCTQLEYLLDNDQVIKESNVFEKCNLSDHLIQQMNKTMYLNTDLYFLKFCNQLSVVNCTKHVLSHNLKQLMKMVIQINLYLQNVHHIKKCGKI